MSAQTWGPFPPTLIILGFLVAGGNPDTYLDPSISVINIAMEDGDGLQVG